MLARLTPSVAFQPTPPYGDEQKAMQQIVYQENYNPHPRMEMNLCHYIATHQNLLQPTPRMGMNSKKNQ